MEYIIVKKEELSNYAEDFCKLYKTAFKDYFDEKVFLQRYYRNPYNDICMCLAVADGHIVANYSASPREAIINGEIVKCAQSLNTVTHPDYFGKGLFVTLANILYSDMEKKGYKFIYGFPNYISNRTFNNKLQWKTIYEVPMLTLELENRNELSRKMAGEIKESVDIQDFFNNDMELNGEKYVIRKSPEYLAWRYMNNVQTHYDYVYSAGDKSWAIFKVYENIINIVEIHGKSIEEYQKLLNWIIMYGVQLNMKQLTVWSAINTQEHYLLEKYGFRNRYPIYYFGARLLDASFNNKIFDYRSWYLQMGEENEY